MVNQEQVLEILHAVGEKITEEKLFLTELDNVIGDGDHGINLARGFAEIEKKRPMMEGKDIGTMLKTAGMALVSTGLPARCTERRSCRQAKRLPERQNWMRRTWSRSWTHSSRACSCAASPWPEKRRCWMP